MNILPKVCHIGFFREKSNIDDNNSNNSANHLNPMRVYPEEEKHDIESNADEHINRISDAESDNNIIIVQNYYPCNSKQLCKYIIIIITLLSMIVIIHYVDYAIYKYYL